MTETMILRNLPEKERPRERLRDIGAEALGSHELIAILIRLGTRGESAVSLSHRLLARYGSLKRLAQADVQELSGVKGIGTTKAVTLKAAFELARRLSREVEEKRVLIKHSSDVFVLLSEEMRLLQKEIFKVVALNAKNCVVRVETVTVGLLDANLIHPRELFRSAIQLNAISIILVHNHPSGNPEPSPEDIFVTKRLSEAGRVVDIEVKDHIIIGEGRYFSMRDKGYLSNSKF